ncbi:helix-turn-helix transcriptional regulator [Methylopila turkensis]|uniref:HTH luxR-type domain-containing protein n=1 Tax=Methylopila turkensis TaxID=1437816 RepID=A0A9W6JNB7_9HYPH|nr:helix-turn-helix transcriptional regulator [Methylopila turkensis]GLK79304.1 hypothetical protein GCM10008174_10450 [Methylopila turkensis]
MAVSGIGRVACGGSDCIQAGGVVARREEAIRPQVRLRRQAPELDEAAVFGAVEALQACGKAAALIGRGLELIAATRRAESHFGAGLKVTDGVLAASDSRCQPAFAHLAAIATSAEYLTLRRAPDPAPLHRARGRPLIADAAPFRLEACGTGREVRAIILLTDPDEAPPAVRESALTHAFRLSATEARLVAALARGETLESCAAARGVALSTVRNQLAAAFDKTGVRRQSELIALVARVGGAPG